MEKEKTKDEQDLAEFNLGKQLSEETLLENHTNINTEETKQNKSNVLNQNNQDVEDIESKETMQNIEVKKQKEQQEDIDTKHIKEHTESKDTKKTGIIIENKDLEESEETVEIAETAETEETTENKELEEQKAEKEKEPPRPPIKPFVHLHLHSEYSLLDGASRITRGKKSPLLDACIEKGMAGCAITDHGNMFGVYTFYKKAKEKGIKPIVGCEFYTASNMHVQNNERFHLILLAKSTEGYRNLVKMDSLAYTEGFYYKPRIDIELLKKHSKGLICLSACLSSKIDTFLVNGEYDSAKEYAIMLRDMFEEGDFYIELQDHGIAEQRKINPLKVKLAREIGVKIVATNDAHYIERKDSEMHDVLLCIQTGKNIDDPNRMKFDSDEFYLKDYDEMMEIFDWCPEAVTNTVEVMEKCNIIIDKEDLFPPYKPDDGSLPADYLRKLAYEGLINRYGELTKEITERADFELEVIIRMGFAEYYLIVWDFINYARINGISVGDGRGSGVGSIIAYAMHITNMDPLRFSLLFERFLNPERVSAPDFDIDFCMDRRSEVIDYVVDKYGKDKVCQILALGTMKAKGAIKDVARVYNVPLDVVNKTTKPIPNAPGVTLDKVLGRTNSEEDLKLQCPEVIEIYENNSDMHRVIDMALQIEGMPRNCSKHAAGVVICKEVISDFVPLQKNGNDITTQFQKDEVEELGMLKMDFLGLTTLTDISKACQYIFENHGVSIDFDSMGYEDEEVYKLISTGDTGMIFQLESVGMQNFMKQLQPESLEDVIAGISLYRPGPMDCIPGFIESKQNPQKITYKTPLLEPILNMTYGYFVYQEQVMQAVQTVGGYTLGRADILRRAMGKKKVDIMKAEKQIFVYGCPEKPQKFYDDGSIKSPAEPAVDGAIKRGVDEQSAKIIFDQMQDFAKYAFNKSHAAAYAALTYKTGYLKRYYFIELVAAIINNRITKADEIAKYLTYVKEAGRKVLPPDVNKSDVIFRATKDGEIRFGLNGIKNVGEQAVKMLVEERKNGEYKSVGDLLRRLPAGTINKKIFEGLIKAGALDSFGHTRASLMASYENLILQSNFDKKMQSNGQMSLFGFMEESYDNQLKDDIKELKEFARSTFLAMEKEVLNIYMSGHPLEEYAEDFKCMEFNLSLIKPLLVNSSDEESDDQELSDCDELNQLANKYNEKIIMMGGMLTNFKKSPTKKGSLMAYGTIEDLHGAIEVVIFPKTLDKYKDLLHNDSILKISGKLNTISDRGVSLSIMTVSPWTSSGNVAVDKNVEETNNSQTVEDLRKLCVKIKDLVQFKFVADLCDTYPGKAQVRIQYDNKLYSFNPVRLSDRLVNRIIAEVGEENVKII